MPKEESLIEVLEKLKKMGVDISEPLRVYTACEESCQKKLQTILERLERIEKILEELRKAERNEG